MASAFVRDPVDVLAELGAVAIQEQAGQLWQIVDPLPQRRQLDRDDVDPVEQILAEGACLDSLFQVCVRRDDQSEVGPDQLATADPFDLALLNRAEQLRLQIKAEVSDLVEKQGATSRQLELAQL